MSLTKLIFILSFLSILAACSSQRVATSADGERSQLGKASYYANKYHGRTTANGEVFSQNAETAAHLDLPFGTKVKVTNLANNKFVIVRINDRGPYVRGRVIDLSLAMFKKIADPKVGVIDVSISVLKPGS
ncbi:MULTISPECIES: septal ring lytic transglycosylase RlpA family protein [unclassified Pseudoalteromonas]|uniref:septal ring lytic transglycosylase RlpA family protein n=1 Tax=unclassified Pseudoalteromonas TaxID=194690 RepID=UPI0011093527|nr:MULTISPECIES: septal ring lytic transglycosylase RlpA family protein [unclassified Pseudoalteromonas]TMN83934.1 septal ring lytic transglycosylase RlpA family lipoprotein [Pseudoalteromonas sp. S410]TMN88982.1 septal ring lytic transglycosylase RlpA family lipoprotein [Pseudoalteromonas sp. S408]TMN98699.1 septal ring lytic transglycosylase RlpA family lipoprotein [Pseudoalteromonas sp. S407]TMO01566.1 septal ring lytic transglycosylase RlpA family lipoprotein [Pseudoalteromonas sp. S409]TM